MINVQRRIAAVASVVAAIAATLSYAGAQTTPGAASVAVPIVVKSCGVLVNSPPSSSTTMFGIPISQASSGTQIEFLNASRITATVVNFAVTLNGDSFLIRDTGTFSPGVTISHTYATGAGESYVVSTSSAPGTSCRVASVIFADGSEWRAVPAILHPGAPSVPTGAAPLR